MNRSFSLILLFVAMMTIVSCKKGKTDEPKDPTIEQNGGNQNEAETTDPVNYTLTVVNLNKPLGMVSGSGIYEKGTIVPVTAEPINGAHVFGWSDVEGTLSERAIELVSDSTIVVMFEIEGVEAVDLGLSVKWATCNVGATSPEEYGNYFAWGETETKTTYNGNTYFDTTDGGSTFTEYTAGGKTVLDLEDDAAAVNMGGVWRMPTREEISELLTKCTWTYTTTYNDKSVKGYVVTSQTNDNSIFLPAAGYQQTQSSVLMGGSIGYYWTSNLYTASESRAWVLLLNQSNNKLQEDVFYRYTGRSVRAVMK